MPFASVLFIGGLLKNASLPTVTMYSMPWQADSVEIQYSWLCLIQSRIIVTLKRGERRHRQRHWVVTYYHTWLACYVVLSFILTLFFGYIQFHAK